MINYVQAVIDSISLHYIPNKSESSSVKLGDSAIPLNDEELAYTLLKIFFDNFKEPEYYCFEKNEAGSNQVEELARSVFDGGKHAEFAYACPWFYACGVACRRRYDRNPCRFAFARRPIGAGKRTAAIMQ